MQIQSLQVVRTYEYLGSTISPEGNIEADINNTLNKAIKIKIEKLNNQVVLSTTTYSRGTWTLQRKYDSRIGVTEKKVLKQKKKQNKNQSK